MRHRFRDGSSVLALLRRPRVRCSLDWPDDDSARGSPSRARLSACVLRHGATEPVSLATAPADAVAVHERRRISNRARLSDRSGPTPKASVSFTPSRSGSSPVRQACPERACRCESSVFSYRVSRPSARALHRGSHRRPYGGHGRLVTAGGPIAPRVGERGFVLASLDGIGAASPSRSGAVFRRAVGVGCDPLVRPVVSLRGSKVHQGLPCVRGSAELHTLFGVSASRPTAN